MFQDSDHPWFLWSEEMTAGELRQILAGEQGEYLQGVYLGRLLREARLKEIWEFLTPEDIQAHWPRLERHLGRKKPFWQFLMAIWKKHGLVAG